MNSTDNFTEPQPIIQALTYIKNTNLGATPIHFMEDHNPVGAALWRQVNEKGYATVNDEGRILLTNAGEQVLSLR